MSVTYEKPQNLAGALDLLGRNKWQIISGGTDFFPALGDSAPQGHVLDISHIKTLRHISQDDDHWRIGALITWSDLTRHDLPAAFDGLVAAGKQVGSIQIQNRATIAGNLCNASPAADGIPPLLTLDAQVEIANQKAKRQLPASEFILGNRETSLAPDELLTAILVPKSAARGVSTFQKLGARKYLVISITMVATRLAISTSGKIKDAAIAVGACSPVAQRLKKLEDMLIGQNISAAPDMTITPDMLDQLTPITDVRSTREYRLAATAELISRALTQTYSKFDW